MSTAIRSDSSGCFIALATIIALLFPISFPVLSTLGRAYLPSSLQLLDRTETYHSWYFAVLLRLAGISTMFGVYGVVVQIGDNIHLRAEEGRCLSCETLVSHTKNRRL